MKFLLFSLLLLVLLSVESVAATTLGLSVTRFDVSIAVVVFLALRATLLEGAFTSFAAGYLLGVFTGRPTGLFPFLAVLIYLLVRATSSVVDARARSTTAMLTGVAALLHGLLAFFFTWLTAKAGISTPFSFGGLLLQGLLSAVAAALLFPLFRRIEPGEHPAPGGLSL